MRPFRRLSRGPTGRSRHAPANQGRRERSYRGPHTASSISNRTRAASALSPQCSASSTCARHTYPFLLFAAWGCTGAKRDDLGQLDPVARDPANDRFRNSRPQPSWGSSSRSPNGSTSGLRSWQYRLARGHPAVSLRPVAAAGRARIPRVAAGVVLLNGEPIADLHAVQAVCVLTLIWRLRHTDAGDTHQQIKWALFGFSGYALFLSLASPST